MIRRITEGDRELFIQLSAEFYHSDAVDHSVPKQVHVNTFDELMRGDEYLECYILESELGAAGYALLSRSFSPEVGGIIVWLEEIYITPENRSKGLGGEFFEYLFENIPAARYRLEAVPENERAKSLYSRMGFKPLGYEQMIKDMPSDS